MRFLEYCFHYLTIDYFLLQMTLSLSSWANQSCVSDSSEGAAMSLPHHHTAAPALPLDQSCLPEESASATRAHSINSSNSSSHHSSPAFSNTMPEFMESVIDSVSLYQTFCVISSAQVKDSLAISIDFVSSGRWPIFSYPLPRGSPQWVRPTPEVSRIEVYTEQTGSCSIRLYKLLTRHGLVSSVQLPSLHQSENYPFHPYR